MFPLMLRWLFIMAGNVLVLGFRAAAEGSLLNLVRVIIFSFILFIILRVLTRLKLSTC